MVTVTSGMETASRMLHSSRHLAVGMRPALRSVTRPSPSTVQKFSLAATSPEANPMPNPRADRAPRPISFSQGSYPNRARCAGPLPGVKPGPSGLIDPELPVAAKRSRLGSVAVSSSDFPVSGCGRPPRPSITRRTILASLSPIQSLRVCSELITASPIWLHSLGSTHLAPLTWVYSYSALIWVPPSGSTIWVRIEIRSTPCRNGLC